LTIKKSIVFFAAILIPTIIIVIYCSTYEHGLSNAYLYYIKNAAGRLENLSILRPSSLFDFYYFLRTNWFNSLFILIILSFGLLIFIRPRLNADWWFLCLIILFTIYAILKPILFAVYFLHYMLFLLVPALVFLIITLRIVSYSPLSPFLNFLVKRTHSLKKEIALPVFLVIFWLFIFNGFAHNVASQTILSVKNRFIGNDEPFSNISRMIIQQTDPDDYIVVWGWEARINIYTNRRSATAQSDVARLFNTVWGNYPHENITNYINDIKMNRPKLIVDVVAPGSVVFFEEKYALENHKEVWDAIKNDYELTDIYPLNSGSFKIYTRRNE
jgi:hypothetical protein